MNSVINERAYALRRFTQFAVDEHGHIAIRVVLLNVFGICFNEAGEMCVVDHMDHRIVYRAAFALHMSNVKNQVSLIALRKSIPMEPYPLGCSQLRCDMIIVEQYLI